MLPVDSGSKKTIWPHIEQNIQIETVQYFYSEESISYINMLGVLIPTNSGVNVCLFARFPPGWHPDQDTVLMDGKTELLNSFKKIR